LYIHNLKLAINHGKIDSRLHETHMITLLFIVPILAIATSLFVYQLNGKKEIIKLDLVQFFYAFLLAPILFIWIKSVLYVLLRSELDLGLSPGQLFLVDTSFSLFFLYVFAFVVMHSLTKSINLKVGQDPLHDIFQHSEYFHLWISHIVIYVGSGVLFSCISIANAFFPLVLNVPMLWFYTVLVVGFITGLLSFMGIWLSDPKQHAAHFLVLMKLCFGSLLVLHIFVFFLLGVEFSPEYGLYWTVTVGYLSLIMCFFFAHKSQRALTFIERVSAVLKHQKWDKRVQLFMEHKIENVVKKGKNG
jgi:hypothetical protein